MPPISIVSGAPRSSSIGIVSRPVRLVLPRCRIGYLRFRLHWLRAEETTRGPDCLINRTDDRHPRLRSKRNQGQPTPSPHQRNALDTGQIGGIMATKITREVLEAYLECQYK